MQRSKDPGDEGSQEELEGSIGPNEELLQELYEEPGAYAGSMKKSFGCADDNVLLKAVNETKPWRAGNGQIMQCWAELAIDLRENRRFRVAKDGPGCKTRFDKLVKAYAAGSLAAMRRSGTDEEFGECEQLLEDIISQISDFKSERDEETAAGMARKDGIEKSGTLMRQLAMESLSSSDDCGDRKNTPSKRGRVEGLFDIISNYVNDMAREDPTITAFTTFLKNRLEQDDEREEKRQRREEEREQKQHERDIARDKMNQEFLLNIMRNARGGDIK
ncbi:hypothetical protein AeMF1_005741 [Aphanomyces euteiches]|nr:hypothetical protein AeMF1_005741 [Aphanomyces euteiches]KAH9184020.1 hypothetical protein AeNC1_014005 [Aphanomyces euteiches]